MGARKNKRIDLRATEEVKAVIDHAALLTHTTASEFILAAAYSRAQKTIRRYSDIVLTTTDWRIICQAVENSRQNHNARKLITRVNSARIP